MRIECAEVTQGGEWVARLNDKFGMCIISEKGTSAQDAEDKLEATICRYKHQVDMDRVGHVPEYLPGQEHICLLPGDRALVNPTPTELSLVKLYSDQIRKIWEVYNL
jgi:hypothetical protein